MRISGQGRRFPGHAGRMRKHGRGDFSEKKRNFGAGSRPGLSCRPWRPIPRPTVSAIGRTRDSRKRGPDHGFMLGAIIGRTCRCQVRERAPHQERPRRCGLRRNAIPANGNPILALTSTCCHPTKVGDLIPYLDRQPAARRKDLRLFSKRPGAAGRHKGRIAREE